MNMDIEVQSEATPTVTVDKLANIYIKMRDKRSLLKKAWEVQDKEIAEQMDMLEQKMLDTCKEMNADSIKTKHGTIIRSVKTRYWTNDWDSMYKFIKEHDAFGMLEKRIAQTNTKQFLEENPDLLPMGLNLDSEYTVVVRRSKEN
jgi:hypothetical protein